MIRRKPPLSVDTNTPSSTSTTTSIPTTKTHQTTTTTTTTTKAPTPTPTTTTNDSILSTKWLIWLLIGITIRYVLFTMNNHHMVHTLQKQVEFSTPTTNFKRLTEALHLITHLHQSPYNSTMFLQPPLLLLPFLPFYPSSSSSLSSSSPISSSTISSFSTFQTYCQILFIGIDVCITILLFQIAKMHRSNINYSHYDLMTNQNHQHHHHQHQHQKHEEEERVEKVEETENFMSDGFHKNLPHIIAALYLFNPIIVLSCVSMSTVIFNNWALALTLFFALRGNVVWCSMSLSLSCYQTLFPLVLIIPLILMLHREKLLCRWKKFVATRKKLNSNFSSTTAATTTVAPKTVSVWLVGLQFVVLFVFWLGLWMLLSYVMMNHSWQFIEHAYIYPMSVQDLTPNWSNFWYMFTEVFDHFRKFFLLIFHVHQFAYILPMTVRLKYVVRGLIYDMFIIVV